MYRLQEVFDRAYDIIFEADQSKMTPSQVQKDIQSRNNAQTIGMEIEMYTNYGSPRDVESYIKNELNIQNANGNALWEGDYDGSLNAEQGELTNVYNQRLDNGEAFDVVLEYMGRSELDEAAGSFVYSETDTFEQLEEISDNDSELQALDENDEDYEEKREALLSEIEEFIDSSQYPDITRMLYESGEYTWNEMSSSSKNSAADKLEYEPEFIDWLHGRYYDDDGTFDEYDDRWEEVSGTEGVEIKFSRARKLSDLDKILEEVNLIMHDDTLNPIAFDGVDDEGNTGLHIHFGLAQHNPTNLDLIRLMVNVAKNEDEIVELGGRPFSERWAPSISNYAMNFKRAISKEFPDSSIQLPEPKFNGMTYTHIGGKGTVEFRWAHAELAYNSADLRNYIELLVSMINKSFTGSNEFEYDDVIIKEISKGKVGPDRANFVVIKDGKVIKRLAGTNQESKIMSRKSKMMDVIQNYKDQLELYKSNIKKILAEFDSNKKKISELEEKMPAGALKELKESETTGMLGDVNEKYKIDKESKDIIANWYLINMGQRKLKDKIEQNKEYYEQTVRQLNVKLGELATQIKKGKK